LTNTAQLLSTAAPPMRSSIHRSAPGMGEGVPSSRAARTTARAPKSELRFAPEARHRRGRSRPPTTWAGRPCSGQASPPVGGGNGGHVKMPVSVISTRLLEVISKPPAENDRSLRKRPFSDFQGHFHGHEGGPRPVGRRGCLTGMERTSNEAPCRTFHPGYMRMARSSALHSASSARLPAATLHRRNRDLRPRNDNRLGYDLLAIVGFAESSLHRDDFSTGLAPDSFGRRIERRSGDYKVRHHHRALRLRRHEQGAGKTERAQAIRTR
jgi:hypothetical protein